jgi:outer membrane protein
MLFKQRGFVQYQIMKKVSCIKKRKSSFIGALLLCICGNAFAEGQNLLDIYHLAVSKDPSLASARSNNLAVQEKIVQSKALYQPTVTFDAKAEHSETDIKFNGPGVIFRNAGRQSFEGWGYGLNLNQPIFRKQNIVQNQQAKTLVTQAEKQLALAQQDLMIRVSQAYFDYLLAQDKIDLTLAQKTAIERQLDQAKANFEVGTATITDVNEAQAKHDLVNAQEIAARNELEIKKRAIQSITGEAPSALMPVKTSLEPNNPEPNDIEKWVEFAEQNSLALQIQQQALELAQQEVDRNQAGHLPTLDAVASFNDNRTNGGVNGFGNYLQSAVIGFQFQIPLYQGGAVSSKVREAIALKQKAQDDLETVRRKSALDTRQAYLNLTSSVAQVKAYQQALVSSQSQLDSTNLGYEVGVRTSVDVLNAQQQYFSAKRDLLQARYQYLLSILQLKFATGLIAENDLTEISQQFGNASQPASKRRNHTN